MDLLDKFIGQGQVGDGIFILLPVIIHFVAGKIARQPMIEVQHAGNAIEAESVKPVLFQPVPAIG